LKIEKEKKRSQEKNSDRATLEKESRKRIELYPGNFLKFFTQSGGNPHEEKPTRGQDLLLRTRGGDAKRGERIRQVQAIKDRKWLGEGQPEVKENRRQVRE